MREYGGSLGLLPALLLVGLGCIFIFQEAVRGSVVAGRFNGKVFRNDALLSMMLLFIAAMIGVSDY